MRIAFFSAQAYEIGLFVDAARARQLEADFAFVEAPLSLASAPQASGCAAVCAFVNDRLDAPVLQALGRLGVRLVALRCAGSNQVDLDAAGELGLTVVRVPGYSPHAVAEHVLALTLALNRKIHRAYTRVRDHNFTLDGLVGFDLHGKTVGIIGTGRIGRIVAQIFAGFGCHVLAYDPQADPAWATAHGVRYAPLAEVLASSRVLTLHLPLVPATRHMIDAESLALMPRGAMLINTSRGALVDSAALIEALKSGHLSAAGLDVYEEEQEFFFHDLSAAIVQDDQLARLVAFPNVILTAHQGFLTQEALTDIATTTVASLDDWAQARPLEHKIGGK